MANLNFNSANQSFRTTLGNGITYRVPRFQRDYSWTEEQWDDLWQDLCALEDDDSGVVCKMKLFVTVAFDAK